MNILYTTSFNKHLYEATGKNLIQSFVHHKTAGDLLIAYEDEIDAIIPKHRKFLFHNLDCDDYLQNWLINNRDIIPEFIQYIMFLICLYYLAISQIITKIFLVLL